MQRRTILRGALALGAAFAVGCAFALGYGADDERDDDDDDDARGARAPAVVLPAPGDLSQLAPQSCLLAGAYAPTPRAAPAAGGAIALSAREDLAAVADADADVVVVLELTPGGPRPVRRVRTQEAPAQVVFASDGRLFVTERGAGSVAVFDARDGRLVCRARVAADPVGVALAPDEQTVYVTSGVSHTLTALDAATMRARFTADVPREPRGIALTPDGARALVAHVAGAPLSVWALLGNRAQALAVGAVPIGTEFNAGAGRDAAIRTWVPSPPVNPQPSQAWTVVVDAERHRAFVPFMVSRTGREVPREVRLDAYGGGSVNPASEKTSFALAVFDLAAGRWASVALPRTGAPAAPRVVGGLALDGRAARAAAVSSVRIPSAAALDPSRGALVVASTGTASIATLRVGSPRGAGAARAAAARVHVDDATAGRGNGLPRVLLAEREISAPQQSVALAVGVVNPDDDPGANASAGTLHAPVGVAVTREGATLVYSQVEHAVEFRNARGVVRVATGGETLPADVARGRRLFFTADDPRLSAGGLSCGGCHPDGRDDGLVWFLSQGPRQTPALAGRLTAPFNWNGSHRSLEGNIAQTVGRLGGTGLPLADVDALAAFVARGLRAPGPPAEDARATRHLVERGRELFAGAAACATCHDPARNFTDGLPHELGGVGPDETVRAFDTPSLRYVGATAPYFHDGRYPTLRALLTDATHRMGRVEGLTSHDVDALTAYLETL